MNEYIFGRWQDRCQCVELQQPAALATDFNGRQQSAWKSNNLCSESYTSNMRENDDDSTNSLPAEGDDDGPEGSLGLADLAEWDERNRELFVERERIGLQLEELGTQEVTNPEATESRQQIGLRHELLRNYSQIIDTNRGLVCKRASKVATLRL
jgi:hypothetical protein